MTKYKVLKQLIWHEVGEIVDDVKNSTPPYEQMQIKQMLQKGMIEEVKEEKLYKLGCYVPEEGEKYYFIGNGGKIGWANFRKAYIYYKWDITCGNSFKTKEEAERGLKIIEAKSKCNTWITENDNEALGLNWDNNKKDKWTFFYDYDNCQYGYEAWKSFQSLSTFYFTSGIKAEQFITECKAELETIRTEGKL